MTCTNQPCPNFASKMRAWAENGRLRAEVQRLRAKLARVGVRDTDGLPPDTRPACARCEAPALPGGLCAAHLADSCLTPPGAA